LRPSLCREQVVVRCAVRSDLGAVADRDSDAAGHYIPAQPAAGAPPASGEAMAVMSNTTATPSDPGLATPRRRRMLPPFQEAGLLAVVLVLGVFLSVYGYHDALPGRPNTFLNPDNLIAGIATPMSYYAIMAMGLTVVVITGGIDISVGSIMALAGLVTAWALQQFPRDTSAALVLPISIFLPLGVGLACGLVNGLLVTGLRMHPFIVTLGTLSIFRGIANVLPFGAKTLPIAGAPLPDASVTHLFRADLAGLQLVPMVVTLAVIALGWLYLRHTVFGRETYAVGGNEEAARFSGIAVRHVKLRAYAISGLLAGLAGLVSLGRFGTISASSGTGYELTVVAAAVVGGASLTGGRGSAIGALLGTLILSMIENAINILRLNQENKNIIVGLSIIVAVVLDRLSDAWRERRARRQIRS
jgi:ribose/xylose/arabinose/galactoside ABC-type transport system permease subunit